jgi:hypothetical protein
MKPFPDILVLVGILAFAVFVLVLVLRNLAHWQHQRGLPVSGDEAVVAAKRAEERYTIDTERKLPHGDYFITFRLVRSGECPEMRVNPTDFKALSKGDQGILWHQGTIFRRFENR